MGCLNRQAPLPSLSGRLVVVVVFRMLVLMREIVVVVLGKVFSTVMQLMAMVRWWLEILVVIINDLIVYDQ